MVIINTISEIRKYINEYKMQGLTVGFVPTMGYLHEGHMSLVKRAKNDNDKVVVSIFVNPTQFAPNEDFEKYPRNIDRDSRLCEMANADIIFCPNLEEIYIQNFLTKISVSEITRGLCGKSREGHFDGVCLIVAKLFNIVLPDRAYFGEKDFQQLAIVRKMGYDLNFNIEIIGCKTIREVDGLAMSSRNSYLSEEERRAATVLNISLKRAYNLLEGGERNSDIIRMSISKDINEQKLARVDYIEIVDATTLKDVEIVKGTILIALAVFIGKTRLIDNIRYDEK